MKKSIINLIKVATTGISSNAAYKAEMGMKIIAIKPKIALIIIKDSTCLQKEL